VRQETSQGSCPTAVPINTDITERVVIDSSSLLWVDSPMPGVSRKMLLRDGLEDVQATSLVRYDPDSQFCEHEHPLGEEILVLDGTFEDEAGSYSSGTYVKNPAGSRHAPGSSEGCTLFVKLRHLHQDDQRFVVLRPKDQQWQQGAVTGLRVLGLDGFGTSNTALVRWAPGTEFQRHRHYGGEESFALKGVFEDEHQAYPAGTWLRSPHMRIHQPFSRQGCLILVKTGHLLP